MIKIQNNQIAGSSEPAYLATREPVPQFLIGLAPESLADLSWTDPNLGVSDCAWWPEVDQSPALGEYERYGAETLTVDAVNKQVLVTREILDWSAEEIQADKKSRIPQAVTMRQARLALLQNQLLDEVELAIQAAGQEAKIEWEYATEVKRDSILTQGIATALNLNQDDIDNLFTLAIKL